MSEAFALERPRQCLKISKSDAVARQAVVQSGARLGQRGLRVHYLERRRLAVLIPQDGEPQALFSQAQRAPERGQLRVGGLRFGVERIQIGQQLALSERELSLR